MSKNVSAKYYQENKERLLKKLVKDIKIVLKRKRKKQQYGCERYKNFSEYKKQRLLEYRKALQNEKKSFIITISNYYFKK